MRKTASGGGNPSATVPSQAQIESKLRSVAVALGIDIGAGGELTCKAIAKILGCNARYPYRWADNGWLESADSAPRAFTVKRQWRITVRAVARMLHQRTAMLRDFEDVRGPVNSECRMDRETST